jgi:hypothetical protein
MKKNVLLIITSLLSILFITIHLADDITRGIERGGTVNLIVLPVLTAWLYGTLVLTERRSGYILILVFSLFGLSMPVVHMMGAGIGSDITKSSGGFFFVWTLIALGVTSFFSFILSANGLWRLRRTAKISPPEKLW